MLVLLSGPVGSGKTTLCWRVIELARRRGYQIAGILAPAVIEQGHKVGIEAVALGTGEVRLLARNDCSLGGPRVGQYVFDDRTLDWVAHRCEVALIGDCPTGAHSLVFVDEIGRLELEQGAGLARLIPLLAQPRAACVVVIVRDTLLAKLLAHVQRADPHLVTLNCQQRETAWGEVTGLVLSGQSPAFEEPDHADRH